jgi:hypothetical protein
MLQCCLAGWILISIFLPAVTFNVVCCLAGWILVYNSHNAECRLNHYNYSKKSLSKLVMTATS